MNYVASSLELAHAYAISRAQVVGVPVILLKPVAMISAIVDIKINEVDLT